MLTTLCLAEMPMGTAGGSAPAPAATRVPMVQHPSAYRVRGGSEWDANGTSHSLDLAFATKQGGISRPLAPDGGSTG